MNWLDPIGASISLICTFYFTQARRSAWIMGMIAIILNTLLYLQKGLYGSVLLESIYLISMVYGWYQWADGSAQNSLHTIRHLTLKEGIFYTIAVISGILLFGRSLIYFTDSDIPYWDATMTILSLVAQWFLCIKIIQCWFLWFIVDALVAIIQLTKGIPFHSAIHWIYLGLAILGYCRWIKLYHYQPSLNSMN